MLSRLRLLCSGVVIGLGLCLAALSPADDAAEGQESDSKETAVRVFEMRTYIAHPGKFEAMHKRFRDHTTKLFEKHGMENIGYWTPTDGEAAKNTLVYILAYPSREAREASWKAFIADPEWQRVYKESHADGPLVMKSESTFFAPTDYSAIR